MSQIKIKKPEYGAAVLLNDGKVTNKKALKILKGAMDNTIKSYNLGDDYCSIWFHCKNNMEEESIVGILTITPDAVNPPDRVEILHKWDRIEDVEQFIEEAGDES